MMPPELPKLQKKTRSAKRSRYVALHPFESPYQRLKHPRMLRRLAKTGLLHTLYRQDHIPAKELAILRGDVVRSVRRGLISRIAKANPWTLVIPAKAEVEHSRLCEIVTRPKED